MILRKPYAFLIKYFKIIHIVMFVFFAFFVFAIRKIYVFSVELVKTGSYYFVEGMPGQYVPLYLFLLIILLIVVNIFIYSLMKRKNKPVLFYEISVGYLIILLGVLIYFRIFFSGLDGNLVEPLTGVLNRDIILFIYLFNFFFVAFNFARGFGFDIKKFSFDQDKKDLDIEENDNEEFELNVNIDKDKILAKVRKEKRELTYYLKENIKIVIIALSVLVLLLGVKFYQKIIVPSKHYNEKEKITIGGASYMVNQTIKTPYNKYSLTINKEKTYIVTFVEIDNNTDTAGTIGDNRFRLNVGDSYYYPSKTMASSFNDLGETFKNNNLKANSQNNFLVIFEVPKNINEKMYFEVSKSVADYTYERILLEPKEYTKATENYNLNEVVTIENVDLTFTGYKIEKQSFYEYIECSDEEKTNCNTFKKVVLPNENEKLLILDITNANSLDKDFFDNYLWVTTEKKEYTSKNIKVVELKNDKLFISVPKSFSDEGIKLSIKKRDVDYNIQILVSSDE